MHQNEWHGLPVVTVQLMKPMMKSVSKVVGKSTLMHFQASVCLRVFSMDGEVFVEVQKNRWGKLKTFKLSALCV